MLHALILSLLIHAVILIRVLSMFPVRVEMQSATITAVFGAEPARNAVPLRATPASPIPMQLPLPRAHDFVVQNAPSSAVATSAALASSRPLPSEVPPEVAAESPVLSMLAQTSVVNSAQMVPANPVSANDLRQYRLALAIAARRFKYYPVLARERGWEGTVELALSIRSRFPEPEIILVRSSGHEALDHQAQEMMAQAARATELPDGLMGRDLRIVLPVQFSLDGDQ